MIHPYNPLSDRDQASPGSKKKEESKDAIGRRWKKGKQGSQTYREEDGKDVTGNGSERLCLEFTIILQGLKLVWARDTSHNECRNLPR